MKLFEQTLKHYMNIEFTIARENNTIPMFVEKFNVLSKMVI